MPNLSDIENRIFKIDNKESFNDLALKIFHFQFENNFVYKTFVQKLGVDISKITNIDEIPFLPIEFFKSHKILSKNTPAEIVFSSSGTTGMISSKHFVTDICLYENSFLNGFSMFYGKPEDFVFLALLPSYLQRGGSSLVYMAEKLIQKSDHSESGFYLNDYEKLYNTLLNLKAKGKKTILLGVTYALLDMIEKYSIDFSDLIVMETGGMKGRRKEMVREELHDVLTNGFGIREIHSEYGMTELLSQAYSKGEGKFDCPPWMKIKIRDINDPFSKVNTGKTGGINVIDLANLYSCSFIETKDLGKKYQDDSFEVLGRFDNSDVRGCNLLVG
jgi:phenylacetate-coenzyme A ligase PaaK-like adenylate-forming protein